MHAIAFHPDGERLLGGGNSGIRLWKLADGQEIAKQTSKELYAISISRDGKWAVCGTREGARVWDAELREEVSVVEGESRVCAVDVSPDSAKFATGTLDKDSASIWDMASGARLVGPLEHDNDVTGRRDGKIIVHDLATFLPDRVSNILF